MADNIKQTVPCEVIKDLLPNYIDGLTSEKTNKLIVEHLQICPECKASYEAMMQPDLEIALSENNSSDIEKVRFMKKIKKKHRNTVLAVVAGLLVVFVTAYYFTSMRIYPFPIDKMQVVERYQLEDGQIYIKVHLDSNLAGIGAVTYSNGLYSQDDNSLPPDTQEYLLGYNLINRITQQNKPDGGYLHFLLAPGDDISTVYLRGWNSSKQLLLWQEGDILPIPTAEELEQIEEVLPLLGAGYASTY